jgi:hypothetical protein
MPFQDTVPDPGRPSDDILLTAFGMDAVPCYVRNNRQNRRRPRLGVMPFRPHRGGAAGSPRGEAARRAWRPSSSEVQGRGQVSPTQRLSAI